MIWWINFFPMLTLIPNFWCLIFAVCQQQFKENCRRQKEITAKRPVQKKEAGWHNIDLMVEIRRDSLARSFDFRVEKIFWWIGSSSIAMNNSEQNRIQNWEVLHLMHTVSAPIKWQHSIKRSIWEFPPQGISLQGFSPSGIFPIWVFPHSNGPINLLSDGPLRYLLIILF